MEKEPEAGGSYGSGAQMAGKQQGTNVWGLQGSRVGRVGGWRKKALGSQAETGRPTPEGRQQTHPPKPAGCSSGLISPMCLLR